MKSLVLLITLIVAGSLHAEGWLTNYDQALNQAKVQKLPVLVDFTGSDWCIWCIKLNDEVFEKPAFQAWAKGHVILLKLDFPRRLAQSEATKKANAALAEKYGISGFPTIVLLDENGKELKRTGYKPGGAEAYIKHLEGLLK